MKLEYQLIKCNNNFCTNENQFINLLETNSNYKINKENSILQYKKLSLKYDIKKYDIKENNEIMFVICFLLDDETQIEKFEKFDKSFINFIIKFNNEFSLNVLWDDIFRKYAEELYPQFFYIESLLRKIIYYFMGKNVGNNWTQKCFPKDVANSIKSVKDKNQAKSDENILYYADFIQLSNLLFTRYPNELINQDKFIECLKENKYNNYEIINRYEYKSNWDRYFESVVKKENLENNLKNLYDYRNLVAHNRKIRECDKKDAETLISKIKKILDSCLSKIDEIDVPKEEKESLENMSYQIFSPSNYRTENNIDFYSTIDSLKSNLELNSMEKITSMSSALKSFSDLQSNLKLDSLDKYSGMSTTLKSLTDSLAMNSIERYTGMSSALKSFSDLQSNLKINSLDQYSGINTTLKSLSDSVNSNLAINSMDNYFRENRMFKDLGNSLKLNFGINNSGIISKKDSKTINDKPKNKKKKDDKNKNDSQ